MHEMASVLIDLFALCLWVSNGLNIRMTLSMVNAAVVIKEIEVKIRFVAIAITIGSPVSHSILTFVPKIDKNNHFCRIQF